MSVLKDILTPEFLLGPVSGLVLAILGARTFLVGWVRSIKGRIEDLKSEIAARDLIIANKDKMLVERDKRIEELTLKIISLRQAKRFAEPPVGDMR